MLNISIQSPLCQYCQGQHCKQKQDQQEHEVLHHHLWAPLLSARYEDPTRAGGGGEDGLSDVRLGQDGGAHLEGGGEV